MGDRLRPLWDFDDLDVTETRLGGALAGEGSDEGRAEVLTQLARVEGLRGEFDAGERLIDQARALAGSSAIAGSRASLELGRLRRSAGDDSAARPLFEAAYASALDAGEEFVAVDAAHMAALVADDRRGFLAWTERGLEIAGRSSDPAVAYWAGPLLNNLGWEYFEAGDYDEALDAFERALQARERDPANDAAVEIARYAVAKALLALGRAEDAAGLLEQAVAWTEGAGKPDGWFHEELAEAYAALGRAGEARTHASLALQLLREGDPSLSDERVARLEELAR